MRKTTWMFAGVLTSFCLSLAAPVQAADGDGLIANPDQAGWSRWQGRISYDAAAPIWRSGLGGFESGGFNVKRTGSVNNLSLMGDYYFAPSLAVGTGVGGFRATSGLIIGPRSQASVSQPGLATNGSLTVGNRLFGQSSLPYNSDAFNDTATLPYLGLGYTGLSARGGWSFSADLGMIGQSAGGAANRLFGTIPRSMDDQGHDLHLTPLVQVGVLYSF